MRSVCAVEVAVEVDQVGLHEQAAAGLEGRAAPRRSPRAGCAVRPGRVDAVARARLGGRRARGWRSGMPSSRPRRSPCTTSPSNRNGPPRNARGLADLAGGDERRGCGSRRRSRRRPPRAAPRASRTRRARRRNSGVPRAPLAEAEVLARPRPRSAPRRPISTSLHELLRGALGELPSNGMITSSSTPSPAIRSRLTANGLISFGAASGRITDSGCGSKVSTVSLPRDDRAVAEVDAVEGADRDPARARARARRREGEVTFMRARTLRRAGARSPRGLRPMRRPSSPRGSAARRARPAARRRRGTAAVSHGPGLVARRARAPAGRRAPRRERHAAARRVGVAQAEGADARALELLAVGVAEVRRSACARRCPAEHSISKRRALAVVPEQLCAVHRDRALGASSTSSPRARKLRRRAGRRPGSPSSAGGRCICSPVGISSRCGHPARCARARRRGRPCPSASRAARRRGRSWAAPSGSAARAWRGPRARAAARWRTGRACRRGPPSCRAGARGGRRHDVVRGHARGLGESRTPRPGPCARSDRRELLGHLARAAARPAPGTASRWRSPAACGCPPPPKPRAIARDVDRAVGGAQADLAHALAVVARAARARAPRPRALDGAHVVDHALGVGLERARSPRSPASSGGRS